MPALCALDNDGVLAIELYLHELQLALEQVVEVLDEAQERPRGEGHSTTRRREVGATQVEDRGVDGRDGLDDVARDRLVLLVNLTHTRDTTAQGKGQA